MTQIFGTKEWAAAKALRGFRHGLSPVFNDGHVRVGAWIRENLDMVLSDPNCDIVLLGTGGGIVAYSTIEYNGQFLSQPPTGQYRELGRISVQDLLARVGELHFRSNMDDKQKEEARCLDDLLFAQAYAFNGSVGFDLNNEVDGRVAKKMTDAGYAAGTPQDGRWLLLDITEHGRMKVMWDLADKLEQGKSEITPAMITRLALALSILKPGDRPSLEDWHARWLEMGPNAMNELTNEICRAAEVQVPDASASPAERQKCLAQALRNLAEITGELGLADSADRVMSAVMDRSPAPTAMAFG